MTAQSELEQVVEGMGVVEASAAVSVVSAKDDNLNAVLATNVTRALLPRFCFESSSVKFRRRRAIGCDEVVKVG